MFLNIIKIEYKIINKKQMELEKKNLSESKKDKNQEQKNEFKIRRSQKLTKKN